MLIDGFILTTNPLQDLIVAVAKKIGMVYIKCISQLNVLPSHWQTKPGASDQNFAQGRGQGIWSKRLKIN